jgi:hypothetical protein
MTRAMRFPTRAVRWSAAALIGAILADLAEELVDPANTDGAAKMFTAASQHPGRMTASAVLLLATSLLVVPAVFGLFQTLPDRGRRVGSVAKCSRSSARWDTRRWPCSISCRCRCREVAVAASRWWR